MPRLLWSLSLLLFVVGCGYRTPPQPDPVEPRLATFQNPKAIYRGESLRVSWEVMNPQLLREWTESLQAQQRFVIETRLRSDPCVRCNVQIGPEYVLEADSPLLEREGNRFYFFPPLPQNPMEVTLFRVRHEQRSTGGTLSISGFFSAGLPAYFARPPEVTIEELNPQELVVGRVPLLDRARLLAGDRNALRLLRLRWEPLAEKVEFRWQNEQFLEHNQQYYRVSVYRSEDGRRWPETPLSLEPVEGAFLLLPELRDRPAYYHLRWVDQRGHESLPSSIITYAP